VLLPRRLYILPRPQQVRSQFIVLYELYVTAIDRNSGQVNCGKIISTLLYILNLGHGWSAAILVAYSLSFVLWMYLSMMLSKSVGLEDTKMRPGLTTELATFHACTVA